MKGAIFDMDGLLFDTESIYDKAWEITAKEYGFTLDMEMQNRLRGTNGQVTLDIIHEYLPDYDAQELRLHRRALAMEMYKDGIEMKPGVIEILQYLKEKGFKIAVASAAAMDVIASNLESHDLLPYFDVLVSGRDVEKGKPAPDIFEKAALDLGLNCTDCYVFEDARNGVRAGIAAGCKTIMIPDRQAPSAYEEEHAYRIFSSLLDAKAFLEMV